MQLTIIREAKIFADDIMASGKIDQKDRQERAQKSSNSDLLKAKAFIETFTAQEKLEQGLTNEAMGTSIGITIGSLVPLIVVLILAPPLLALLPGIFLAVGVFSLLYNSAKASSLEKRHPSKLLKKLKRLDPDFLTSLDACAAQLEPKMVADPKGLASPPELSPFSVNASKQITDLKAAPNKLKIPKA